MNIRPVSDLRNKYSDVENELREHGAIYFTKNGYATSVLISVDEYAKLTGNAIPTIDNSPTKISSNRGFLNKYANAELIPLEAEAARLHTINKHSKEDQR